MTHSSTRSGVSPRQSLFSTSTLAAAEKRGHAAKSAVEEAEGSSSSSSGSSGSSSRDRQPCKPSVGAVADDVGTEAEVVEAAPIKIARDPGCPTKEEVELHNATHLPHRSWCPTCVKARGKEDPHFTNHEDLEGRKPTVCFDYKSFGQEDKSDDKVQSIIIRDRPTKTTYSHQCECKGPEDNWILQQLLQDLEELGHGDVILKLDGEPSLVKLLREVKARRPQGTILEHPPAYDPQSNGTAEKAVQEVMEQLRAESFN